MATDDERRLVASRLRMPDERDAVGFDCLLAESVRGHEFCETPCDECHRRLAAELADLIEPSCYREALLAEAEGAERSAWYFALDHDEDELRDRLVEAAEDFSDMARRIREACGEVVG